MPGCRVNPPLTAYRRIGFTNHILNQHLRVHHASSKPTPHTWIMWQAERPLTLQLSGAQALLKPLHLVLQEADMPHHVLWRVYLHGNVSRGGRSWYRLVQLLLEDSSLENKQTAPLLGFERKDGHGDKPCFKTFLNLCQMPQFFTRIWTKVSLTLVN